MSKASKTSHLQSDGHHANFYVLLTKSPTSRGSVSDETPTPTLSEELYVEPSEVGWNLENAEYFRLVANGSMGILLAFVVALIACSLGTVSNGYPMTVLQLQAGLFIPAANGSSIYQLYPNSAVLLDNSNTSLALCNNTLDIKACLWTNLGAWSYQMGFGWSDWIASTPVTYPVYKKDLLGFVSLQVPERMDLVLPVKIVLAIGGIFVLIIYLISMVCSVFINKRYLGMIEDRLLCGAGYATGLVYAVTGLIVCVALMGGGPFDLYCRVAFMGISLETLRFLLQTCSSRITMHRKTLSIRVLHFGVQINRIFWLYLAAVVGFLGMFISRSLNYTITLNPSLLGPTLSSGLPLTTRGAIISFLLLYYLGNLILAYFDLSLRMTALAQGESAVNIRTEISEGPYKSLVWLTYKFSWNFVTCGWKFYRPLQPNKLKVGIRVVQLVSIIYFQIIYFTLGMIVLAIASVPKGINSSYLPPPS